MTHKITLDSPYLRLSLHPERACWDLEPANSALPAVQGAQMRLVYHLDGKAKTALVSWRIEDQQGPDNQTSPHGPLQQILFVMQPSEDGLLCRLRFALPERYPFLFWQVEVENIGDQPAYIGRIDVLRAGNDPGSRMSGFDGRLSFFSNGWGSWNHTGAYTTRDHFRRTRFGPLTRPLRVNAGTPRPPGFGHFASDMFAVIADQTSRTGLLAGFLSQQAHFGSLEGWILPPEPALQLWANGDGARLDPAQSVQTDWACLQALRIDDPDPLGPYLEAVARQHGLPSFHEQVPTGWSSWYYYFDKVTADDVLRNLQAAQELQPWLPLDIIQIDDGFETQVGDWYSQRPTFPEGMAPLAKEIRSANFTPGLWLAPFIVDPRSRLANEHPDWLVGGRFGRPANAGYNLWGAFNAALDLTRPAALEYAAGVVRTAIHDWGYPYLKLDFLYAAAIPGRRQDPTRSRAQVLYAGLQALRAAAGDEAILLGCGCPLGSAIGLLDPMRISADVSPTWHPTYLNRQLFIRAEPDFPAARNAIQNVLTRAPLHRRWWINDPDALLLRPDSDLSLPEVQSLATIIALSGGALFISDDMTRLPNERLRLGAGLFPPIGRRPYVCDLFDSATPSHLRLDLENATGAWHLLALFNWSDKTQDLTLRLEDFHLNPAQPYLAREFWSGRLARLESGELRFRVVPVHAPILVALRRDTGEAAYLGSDLHISQGMEVTSWQTSNDSVRLRLERPGPAQGSIDLLLPKAPSAARLDPGVGIRWHSLSPHVYRFPVQLERRVNLTIDFE